jgi:hypothetical protein
MGAGRLMDGVMLIILVMRISWTLKCGRRAQNVADQENRVLPCPLAIGLPDRRYFSRIQDALDLPRAKWGETLLASDNALIFAPRLLPPDRRGRPIFPGAWWGKTP